MSYMTVRDVAEKWGVTERHVQKIVAAGLIPVLRIGRYQRFKPAWVAAEAPQIPSRKRPAVPPECGVYLLYMGDALTYIGRSTNLQKRLCTHRNSAREFDEVRIIPCDDAVADWLEAELIRTLQPPENVKRFERRARLVIAAVGALDL